MLTSISSDLGVSETFHFGVEANGKSGEAVGAQNPVILEIQVRTIANSDGLL